jgi:hypothetical protein
MKSKIILALVALSIPTAAFAATAAMDCCKDCCKDKPATQPK